MRGKRLISQPVPPALAYPFVSSAPAGCASRHVACACRCSLVGTMDQAAASVLTASKTLRTSVNRSPIVIDAFATHIRSTVTAKAPLAC